MAPSGPGALRVSAVGPRASADYGAMIQRSVRARRLRLARLCALLLSSGVCGQNLPSASPQLRADAPADSHRPYAQELRSSAASDLTITVAGSIALSSSSGTLPQWDPRVVEILTGKAFPDATSVAIADLQTTLLDPSAFGGYPYAWDPARAYVAPPGIAGQLKGVGLTMVSVANGHAMDWGIEGMRATSAALDEAGLKHAGTGEREALARMACFLDEPGGKGRIALLASGTSFRPTSNALSPHGAAPGRPGISALEVTAVRLVPMEQNAQLQQLACRFQYAGQARHCDHLAAPASTVEVFGSRFQSALTTEENYSTRYQLNFVQVANELHAVREAKQNSDLAVLSISTGQADRPGSSDGVPSDALVQLAHAAIDAGADLVTATGQPALGPIEIYWAAEGPPRPILYGVGLLYWSPEAVPASASSQLHDAVIVRSRIESDRVRLELYPIDLSAGNGVVGIPRLADPERGRAILERLQLLSAPFHTLIAVDTYGTTVRGVVTDSGDRQNAAGGSR
jgi:poly-gamma-glutamate capsule biosynthesis protein CapA/YwtB (metallophosphatase superfamily)